MKLNLPTGVFRMWKTLLFPPWQWWIKNTYFSLSGNHPLILSLLSANQKCYLLQISSTSWEIVPSSIKCNQHSRCFLHIANNNKKNLSLRGHSSSQVIPTVSAWGWKQKTEKDLNTQLGVHLHGGKSGRIKIFIFGFSKWTLASQHGVKQLAHCLLKWRFGEHREIIISLSIKLTSRWSFEAEDSNILKQYISKPNFGTHPMWFPYKRTANKTNKNKEKSTFPGISW